MPRSTLRTAALLGAALGLGALVLGVVVLGELVLGAVVLGALVPGSVVLGAPDGESLTGRKTLQPAVSQATARTAAPRPRIV